MRESKIKTDKFIQQYCNENNISNFINDNKLVFMTKDYDTSLEKYINIIENNDFNFRCILKDEKFIKKRLLSQLPTSKF